MTEVEVDSEQWDTAIKWYGMIFGSGKGKLKPSRKDIKAKNLFTVLYDQAKKDEELYKDDD